MDIIIGLLTLTGIALVGAAIAALFSDDFGLRVSARLIARVEARRAFRAKYSEILEQREAEFNLPKLTVSVGQPESE